MQCLQPGVETETETCPDTETGLWPLGGDSDWEWRSVIRLAFTGHGWPCPGSSSDSGSTPTPTLRLTISYQLSVAAGPGSSRHFARHWPDSVAENIGLKFRLRCDVFTLTPADLGHDLNPLLRSV